LADLPSLGPQRCSLFGHRHII